MGTGKKKWWGGVRKGGQWKKSFGRGQGGGFTFFFVEKEKGRGDPGPK